MAIAQEAESRQRRLLASSFGTQGPDVADLARRTWGLTEAQARAETRLGIAVIRGLLLDLLATGDTAGADAAHEAYVAALMTRKAQRAGTSGDAPA